MSESLSPAELIIVSLMQRKGFSRHEALVLIILITRSYSRPIADLISTLQHYAGLETEGRISEAISSLTSRGLLQNDEAYGVDIVGPIPEIRKVLGQICDNQDLENNLQDLRKINDSYVTVIGALRDLYTYQSYVDILRSAQSEIVFSMVATSLAGFNPEGILEQRAKAGVKIKILAASPKLAGLIRGNNLEGIARERLREWRRIVRRNTNIELKVCDVADDLIYASSICVDRKILRLVCYNFKNERSKEGMVVEFSAPGGAELNIISAYLSHFDRVFKNAYRPSLFGNLKQVFAAYWQFWGGILITAVCYFSLFVFGRDGYYPLPDEKLNLGLAVVSSIAASFFFVALVEAPPRLRPRWRRR